MLPEDRLQEAIKQTELAADSDLLTETEQKWLGEARLNLEATEAVLSRLREQAEDSEVLDD